MNIKLWIGIGSIIALFVVAIWCAIKAAREDGDWLGVIFLAMLAYIGFLIWCFS